MKHKCTIWHQQPTNQPKRQTNKPSQQKEERKKNNGIILIIIRTSDSTGNSVAKSWGKIIRHNER
jgi:NAD(P)H-hydrate repair Nnr-like enzyme with NAD(P)H-hydrate dehydratase domain